MKVFLDSNVLFSVCWSGREHSRAGLLFELQREGVLQLFVSRLVQAETAFNLQTKRPEAIVHFDRLSDELTVLPDSAGITGHPLVGALPLNDRVIFMTALANGMGFFLTGNTRDFSALYGQRVGTLLTLRPIDFLLRNFVEK